jgi:Domain of unknown function (DUF6285)
MTIAKDQHLAGFLAAAEALLRDNVVATTTGDVRFAGLMVASAIGMAKREIELDAECAASALGLAALAPQPSPFPSNTMALVHLLRAGMMDGEDEVFRRLYADAITRTAVTRPALVSEPEMRLAGLD